ncbi:efflux RND transporter periplasmic adaptor subunit [uncultured Tateyamaria sp.]|uniref:efflux RND transporter periplasmic adaptor subunit n=1 Tax=uncultured Tateyamaria sp. TaxID=455651 RepID=UPI00260D6F80|nr:efflux RND transporter periplasmic adaptor subunit [uncultured Tateyamaria sp.]
MRSIRSVVGFAFMSLVCATASVAQDQVIRPAKVADITASETTISRRYPASVLPSREIELSFKVSGQVIDLPVRAASNVQAGDVIAQIDRRDYENQLAALQSQRDQAAAQLEALKAGARPEEIIALEAAVESAQAQADQAREALTRAATLLERGVATRAQLEAAQAESRVADANLLSQQEQLRIGQAGGRPEDIAASEAAIRGIDAQIKVAQDALSDTTLVAPFDGIVARRDIENFSNVQAGQSIVLLQGLDVVHLAFDIPGPDITQLTRNGPDAIANTAFFDALPGREFPADVVEFSVQADSATQTYRGRVAVEVPEGAVILPGMVANVVSSTAGADAQVFAPLSAIAAKPNGDPFVWLVDDDGMVSEQAVKLGEAKGANVVVTDGLSEGDVVVAAGVSEIIDGTTVRPIRQVGN